MAESELDMRPDAFVFSGELEVQPGGPQAVDRSDLAQVEGGELDMRPGASAFLGKLTGGPHLQENAPP